MLAKRIARVVSWSVVVVGFLGLAHAGDETSPHAHLEGQILVTQAPLPTAAGPERTIEHFEENRQDVITADDGAERWTFRYMAFMTEKPRTGELSIDVHRAADDTWVTSTRLFASPRLTIVSGRANISADEGIEPGGRYTLKLVAERSGTRIVLAETRLAASAPARVASARGR